MRHRAPVTRFYQHRHGTGGARRLNIGETVADKRHARERHTKMRRLVEQHPRIGLAPRMRRIGAGAENNAGNIAAKLARNQQQPRMNLREHRLIERAVGNRALIGTHADAESGTGQPRNAAQGIGKQAQLLRPAHQRVFIQHAIAVKQHQLLGKIKHLQRNSVSKNRREV